MADDNNLTGKVGLDTTGFKAGVNELNAQIRAIETGFRASAAVMGEWSSNSEGLTNRINSLNEKLELQKQKLNLLHSEYDKVVAEQGASSKVAESLANQMYSAEKAISSTNADINKYVNQLETLSKEERKATDETVKLGDSMENAGKSGSSLGEKFRSLTGILGSGLAKGVKAAGAAIAGMGAAATAAAAGFGKMVMSSVDNVDQIQVMADTYALSAERIQELTYAGTKLDVNIETIMGSQSKLIKAMASAEKGTGDQARAFKELGIAVTDGNGHLRDSNEVFAEALDKLHGMTNVTDRNALALKLFGKSAMDLNPLINAGGDALAQLSEEARQNGAVMSNDAVAGLDGYGDSIEALKLSAQGMAGTLSSLALPALNGLTSLLGNLTASLSSALKTGDFSQFGQVITDGITSAIGQLSSLVSKMAPVATKVLTGIINALVQAIPTILPALTQGVIQLIQAGVSILQTNGPMIIQAAVRAITTLIQGLISALPQLVQAAVTILATLTNSISQQLPMLIPMAVQVILTIANGLLQSIPQLLEAGIQLLLGLVQGIVDAIPQLVAMLPTIIQTIIDVLIQNLPLILNAGITILIALINGIVDAIPQLIQMLPTIVTTIVNTLIQHLPQLIDASIKIMLALIEGLIKAIPQLIAAIPQIIKAIWDTITNVDWLTLGKNIIQGIWNGISSLATWLWDQVTGLFNGVVNGVKSVLGIKSPSKVFADIGSNLMLGLGNGIDNSKNKIFSQLKDVTDTINGTSANVSGGLNISSTAVSSSTALDTTNALISAINMAAMKISSVSGQASQEANYTFALDGINLGRGLFPYIIGEAKRLGMVDSSGYLKVKVGAL